MSPWPRWLKLTAIDGLELRRVGVDDPHQPTPSQDGPGAAAAVPESSPIGGPRGAHEVSLHGSQERPSQRPQQLASVASASARNPASSPSWSRGCVRARTRRAARPRGRRGRHRRAARWRPDPGIASPASPRRAPAAASSSHHALGLEAPELFIGPVVDGQRVPEVGRHQQLGGLPHEYQRAVCNRSLHPTAVTGCVGVPSGQRPAGFWWAPLCRDAGSRAGRATARPHAGPARPGRRAAAFAGLRCVQDRSGPRRRHRWQNEPGKDSAQAVTLRLPAVIIMTKWRRVGFQSPIGRERSPGGHQDDHDVRFGPRPV